MKRTALIIFISFLASVAFTFSVTAQKQSSQKVDEKTAVKKVRQMIGEIAPKSFPKIKLKKIHVKTFESNSSFFKARFSFTRFLTFQKMRHLVYVNPKVFELNAPEEGIRAILAHELAHVHYYTRKNRFQLLGLASLSSGSFTAKFERKADLEAIARGYGEGLIQYRLWLYKNISAKSLPAKKRNYFSPEEISLIIPALQQNPDLLEKLRKDVPRNLAQVRERIER